MNCLLCVLWVLSQGEVVLDKIYATAYVAGASVGEEVRLDSIVQMDVVTSHRGLARN